MKKETAPTITPAPFAKPAPTVSPRDKARIVEHLVDFRQHLEAARNSITQAQLLLPEGGLLDDVKRMRLLLYADDINFGSSKFGDGAEFFTHGLLERLYAIH